MFEWLFGKKKKRVEKKKEMEFVLKVEGVDPEDIVKIEGPKGDFYMTKLGGGGPSVLDVGYTYFYGDADIQFFIQVMAIEVEEDEYPDLWAEGIRRIFNVREACYHKRVKTWDFRFASNEQKLRVMQNIEFAFLTRTSYYDMAPYPQPIYWAKIIFTWEVYP